MLLILCGGLLGLLDAPQLTGAKNPILDWQITKSIRVWKVRKREGKRWRQSESRTARQRDRETERQRDRENRHRHGHNKKQGQRQGTY